MLAHLLSANYQRKDVDFMFKVIRILLCMTFIVNMYSGFKYDKGLEIASFITMMLVLAMYYIVGRHCELNNIE
ncbi:hypothetical protein BAQ53_24450 [Bacillus sp. B25(2016b)]|nr:hypothetical protein BAQ53_24450 [Bacillus sp. B25(2016b)]